MKRAIKRAAERLTRNRDNRRTASAEALAHAALQKIFQRIEEQESWSHSTRQMKALRRQEIQEHPNATGTLTFVQRLDEDGRDYLARKYEQAGLVEALTETEARQAAIMRIESLKDRTSHDTHRAVKIFFNVEGRDDNAEDYSHLLEELSHLDATTPEETARPYTYREEAFLIFLSARQSTDHRAKPIEGEIPDLLEAAQELYYIEDDDQKILEHYREQLDDGIHNLEHALHYCDTRAIALDAVKGNPTPTTIEEIKPYLQADKIAESWPYGFTFNGEHYLDAGY